jgi:mobilome CxxCx(11)CxxC protein
MDQHEWIQQKKYDSLSAKYTYSKRLARLRSYNFAVDTLAVVVPGIYLTVRYLAKGTETAALIDGLGEVLSCILLAMVLIKLGLKWQDKADQHQRLMSDNIKIVSMADTLLIAAADDSKMPLFQFLVQKSEEEDLAALGNISEPERQLSYRLALREAGGINAKCPRCHASPWQFKKGTCQLCGNTPIQT